MPVRRPHSSAIVQPLRTAAPVGGRVDHRLLGTRNVVARPHRGLQRFDVGPPFRGDPAGQSAHPVRALSAQRHRPPVHPVAIVEQAIRVQGVGEAPANRSHERRVLSTGVSHQRAFHPILVVGYRGRQHVDRVADLLDVLVADRAVLYRLRQYRQLRRQRHPGQGPPRCDAGRDLEPTPHLRRHETQPVSQHVTQLHPWTIDRPVVTVGRVRHLGEHPIGQAAGDPQLGFQPFGQLDAKGVAHHVR